MKYLLTVTCHGVTGAPISGLNQAPTSGPKDAPASEWKDASISGRKETPTSERKETPTSERKGASISGWKPEEIKAHMDYQAALHRELVASGEYVDGHALTGPELAKVVTSDGTTPVVTGGPFAEPGEVLAGFHLVDVESETRAVEIAGRISQVPGPGGTPLCQPVGVRRLMDTADGDTL
ncbi:YciI family protein [Couchioplanes azureus]|uniref:YciI family protein n=1 Tax=Couchioplanes caeruleus TaxID=56438 RepID=UPI001986F64F|nr:YciI family protein [Couchioplanes caeruleus]GGQ79004.1 hypothetical protein GCM10010166_56170 [Couchioplanes caeruleus subsp. azureus]